MKNRIVSWLLSVAFIVGLIPATAITALASEAEAETVSDAYISVSVSRENGGFTVKTVEGDRLKKSDNNKKLLYHDGQYDTSFLSFRVGEGENVKEYLFGGDYPGSSDVAVTKSPAGDSIEAVWSVDGLTVTQTVALANQEANESGMVAISVNVANGNGTAVPVQARLLLDTGLGEQDYGFYQYTNSSHDTVTVQQERVIDGSDNIPVQLYASDDAYSPSVMAYSVHNAEKPYKVAFAHWNHLASTLFDFIPSTNLDFTEANNEYLTADSAYALYYDLGRIAGGSSAAMNSYYGVFSNHQTPATNTVAVNLTAPVRLELNSAKDGFVSKSNVGRADFAISVDFANIASETAKDLKDVVLAVKSGSNLRSLNDQGEPVAEQDFTTIDAYTFVYPDLAVGQSIGKELYFEAKVSPEAHYERITVSVYDVSQTNGQLSETYKLGERMAYVLLPGTEDNVPQVNFAAMTPKIIYNSGVRHLFVTVANESMLDNEGNWTLKAYREDGSAGVDIPHSNINIKDGIMDVALTEDMELADGDWYLQLEWANSVVGEGEGYMVSPENAKQSAPELHFTVSPDEKYRNDRYGVLAVVEFDGDSVNPDKKKYKICTFASEEDFKSYKADPVNYENGKYGGKYSEIVLTFKGEFTATKKQGDVGTYYTAVSTKEMVDGKPNVKNSVLINDCLDFEDGTLSVYYEDYDKPTSAFGSAVCTEFDGNLYTNGSRTSVWTGRAAITKLEQGKANYSLAPYDENGNRISLLNDGDKYKVGNEKGFSESNEAICLMWPNVGAVGQTLSGLLFKLAYGQFGRMYKTNGGIVENEIGTVVSFAAALDLTFASGNLEGQPPDTYWDKLQMVWYNCREGSPYLCQADFDRAFRALNWSDIEENADWTKQEAKASVMVRDVIFGCGKGFVGVNFTVGVAITNYVSGLPEIQGTISVNTINNWSYGIEGKIDLEAFYVEAKVSFRSKNNIPVPDELYVFVSGFQPGINIDGLGVCWITGGGGGIKNLYDTIFCTQKVPPLKLMLSVSFDIIKVLECKKATLTLGMTGVSLSAQDIGIKALPGFTAIRRMGLSLEWYPGIDMRANIVVDLFQGVIYGGGYLVVISPDYKDVFFEMFARAKLQVPNSIPIVGGMSIGGADLGLNSDKIWGAIDVLSITLGVTYHWGESDVDFSSGSKTQPTFPELLGYDEIPVGYDTESGHTLYARVGTNTQLMASNMEDNGGLVLMSDPGVYLKSDSNRQNHTFNLGQRGTDNAIVQIVFDAESEADAKTKAAAITIGSAAGTNDYGLVLYDAQQNNLSVANANLTYDETTKRATFAFTATDATKYNKTWYLTTPSGSDVLLYNVEEVPEVTSVSGMANGDTIDLTWNGTNMSELDKISFYLCKNNDVTDTDPGYRIGMVEDSAVLESGRHTLTVPGDVPSGDYYIRAVYSKTDEVNGVVFSTGEKLSWHNSNTPGRVVILGAKADGDLQYELTLQQDANTDGYLVSIYNEDGTVTDFEQVSYESAESGDTVIQVGGTYQAIDPQDNTKTITVGLEAEKKYIIGVTPYHTVDMGSGESALRGEEVKTSAIYLPTASTPTLTFSADQTAHRRVVEEAGIGSNGTVVTTDVTKTVYTANALTVTAKADEAVSGTWKLNEGVATAFENTDTITIELSDLPDGEHSISIMGEAEDGDGFYTTYTFVVDTMPPQLLLASPVNGSFFNKDGTVTLTGTCDSDARFTVTCDGEDVYTAQPIEEMGGTIDAVSGEFSITLSLPDPNRASQRTLAVSVGDDVGNTTVPKTMTLSHGALAELTDIMVMVNGQTYQNGNIPIPSMGLSDAELSLVGTMKDGTPFNLTGYNVSWDVLTVDGSAEVDDSKFSAEAMSQGIITGKLAVTDTASRSASLCFGAPAGNTVAVSTTIGGSVSGGGEYASGDTVTLTATPDSGYRFVGWTLAGVSGVDTTLPEITFTMPDGKNVTAVAQFEANSTPPAPEKNTVAVSATVGGSVSGGGEYASGDTVTLTATPDSGYRFVGWLLAGVSDVDTTLPEITFTMPDGKNVTAMAQFKANPSPSAPTFTGGGSGGNTYIIAGNIGNTGNIANGRYAQKGEMVEVTLPNGKSEAEYLPYYYGEDKTRIFVPISAAADGKVKFIAPKNGQYYFGANNVSFADIGGRWSESNIIFAAQREIFKGMGNGIFNPEGAMDRSMVIAVLYRLAGSPSVRGTASYTDVESGSWYHDAVLWGEEKGIVAGYGNGLFGVSDVITREQLCAMLTRFCDYMNYSLPPVSESEAFTDADSISDWAYEAVDYCKTRGLIYGVPGGAFAPLETCTREECSAVMERMIHSILGAN